MGIVVIIGFLFSFIGLEWNGSVILPEGLEPESAKLDDWGYGTSFGFRGVHSFRCSVGQAIYL